MKTADSDKVWLRFGNYTLEGDREGEGERERERESKKEREVVQATQSTINE